MELRSIRYILVACSCRISHFSHFWLLSCKLHACTHKHEKNKPSKNPTILLRLVQRLKACKGTITLCFQPASLNDSTSVHSYSTPLSGRSCVFLAEKMNKKETQRQLFSFSFHDPQKKTSRTVCSDIDAIGKI